MRFEQSLIDSEKILYDETFKINGHILFKHKTLEDEFRVQRAGRPFPSGNFSGWNLKTMIDFTKKLPPEGSEKHKAWLGKCEKKKV